jgi:hypothetical protein
VISTSNRQPENSDQTSLESVQSARPVPAPVILSFDVEAHYQIEAAAGLVLDQCHRAYFNDRQTNSTHWLLEQLDRAQVKATFFVVGELAQSNPAMVSAISRVGHEVASHGWDHQRLHNFTPTSFRADVRRSRDALEQITGQAVFGDPKQARLPLARLSCFRTYVGINRTRARLAGILSRYPFARAIDVARMLGHLRADLPSYRLAA